MNWRSSLEQHFNRVWYRPEPPPPLFYRALARVHQGLRRDRDTRPEKRPEVPVIVVGNLCVGGAGKTPVVIALARHLRERGHRVGVVSRGAGSQHHARPVLARPDSDPGYCGDEPVLIARSVEVPVWVCRQRALALDAAINQSGAEVVIADDGLQHRALARSFEICLFDGQRGLGNGRLLPAGPLRQPLGRLESVDMMLVKGGAFELPHSVRFQLRPDGIRPLAGGLSEPLESWRGRSVDAVCGIANPDGFIATLTSLGLRPRTHVFPDHHAFQPRDFKGLAGPVVVTAKDAVKLDLLNLEQPVFVLEVEADLPSTVLSQVDRHINEFAHEC